MTEAYLSLDLISAQKRENKGFDALKFLQALMRKSNVLFALLIISSMYTLNVSLLSYNIPICLIVSTLSSSIPST